jgi:multiple sugar transport system ATP-binding protein
MAHVEIKQLSKSFGATSVLKSIDLGIEDGSFVVFVGPSGCGKSTLLRVIAGLEDATSGQVLFDGKVVNELTPAQREIAMVFQSYALYPHMTVAENMAFSLKLRNASKEEVNQAVATAAKMLGVEDLLDRLPRELSGGQRQRVAIGRAIVRKPKVFLFDEPLSNLDAELRSRMRYELARLHKQLATTMIYVTHDQVEAMTLADKIVVLSAGRIEQIGAPLELYQHPANIFVAGFIGSPKINLMPAEVVSADVSAMTLRLTPQLTLRAALNGAGAKPGDKVTIGIRPEHLAHGDGENAFDVRIDFIERLGGVSYAYANGPIAGEALTFRLPDESAAAIGDTVRVAPSPTDSHVFNSAGDAFPRPRA